MSFSVVTSVRHLIAEYRRFLRSTYKLADERLRVQFDEHVERAEVLVKGPYVTLAQDFAKGQPLAELVAQNVGPRELTRFNWKFGIHPLFLHQERAMRQSLAGRNVVVKTGTGSGKTEAFLLPVLSGVLEAKAAGAAGTKAILLYPMNALANDQLVRLRELLRGSRVPVTFAMYTGESESTSRTLGEPLEDHELVRRDDIRAHPPDILLTNYKQLEFLLVRKVDRALFTPALRWLVLDEIHSYRGALATEIACLIRRLKGRAGLGTGQLHCLGTSATVTSDAGGDEALARFASTLFGELLEIADIIGETTVPKPPPVRVYTPPFPRITSDELERVPAADERQVLALAARITGRTPPMRGHLAARVSDMLDGNELVALLEEECRQPRSLSELVEAVKRRFPGLSLPEDEGLRELIEAYLLVGSVANDDEAPSLRPKLHSFFQGVYDVGICLNPDCRTLVRNGADTCPNCHSVVRPAALCRTCGQDFAKVRFDAEDQTKTYPNDSFQSDEDTGFITARVHFEGEEGEEEPGEAEGNGQQRRRRPAGRNRLKPVWVDHATGHVREERPIAAAETVREQLLLRGRASTCPVCNSMYPRGDIITLLRSGAASSGSVLATHHLERLPDEFRKLLLFADNRQEAAHQAGYMNDKHRLFAVRHALNRIVQEAGAGGVALQDIGHRLLEKFQDMQLASRRLTAEQQGFWRQALEFEAAGEFCRAVNQRASLENLALVEVRYEFLDELARDARFNSACEAAGLAVADAITLVRAVLDTMRRQRAVSFHFFQRYLDVARSPWSRLMAEPYSISVPEHERGVVFFMLDRSEAARGSKGTVFKPLVRDTQRGGMPTVPRLVEKAVGNRERAAQFIRAIVPLLTELTVLVRPDFLPRQIAQRAAGGVPLQVAARVIRLFPAHEGRRCRRCQLWRPYAGTACFATARCSGTQADLRLEGLRTDGYYERLYTTEVPRRLAAREHTAQISDDDRAKRETDFKQGRLEALVCSPTLELGVDIGELLTVLLRNAPPTPANYVQRAGRAGRRQRIGFVSTFCGVNPHDRHCFEDPAWLVRGEFRPPAVKLDPGTVLARHVRSLILEELAANLPGQMSEFVDDLDNPRELDLAKLQGLRDELCQRCGELTVRAQEVFHLPEAAFFQQTTAEFDTRLERILNSWFARIRRLADEFNLYRTLTADRRAEQRAAARKRAFRELTTDPNKANVLAYLAETGVLPSYQFPTDTFDLEPGVNDTPPLRRPAAIALFEFAPGSLVYANGHKLKSIRACFEGASRSTGQGGNLETSGRVQSYVFCGQCGWASDEPHNACPQCQTALGESASVAFVESFEAEENTNITSAEESRQRVYFERRTHLLPGGGGAQVTLYQYPLAALELRPQASLLVTNWGRTPNFGGEGERFQLCPECGQHLPARLSASELQRWQEDHTRRCHGTPRIYVLGHRFHADTLVMPLPKALFPPEKLKEFCVTLGSALVAGAVELLELEAGELEFFHHTDGNGGAILTFYETAPGGAGYLETLASRFQDWGQKSWERLTGHSCSSACYGCLKTYRNQPMHALLDKRLVLDALLHFAAHGRIEGPVRGNEGDAARLANAWLTENRQAPPTQDTEIERRLLEAIRAKRRLPEPTRQREFRSGEVLITVADFAFENEKIAIYCDGFAYHSSPERLASDAQKRNHLQSQGWLVLTFWGKTILRTPERCEEQIWRAFNFRRENRGDT
ncbi:MAG: DEAD/DEAH box helicase [Verrucomicrobia bacterium]|nr:DEAD/DEAH box helicase [Verrucomicrobiota bacterium]